MAPAEVETVERSDGRSDSRSAGWLTELVDGAGRAGEDVDTALDLADRYGSCLPLPGSGGTAARWSALADVAARSLTVARVLEAHTDALAILAEAGDADRSGTWGVFAAEAPGLRLEAATDRAGGAVVLSGTKPWCSLGDRLDAALVTAHVPGGRQLFRVDLQDPGVSAEPAAGWVARGLRGVTSVALQFDAVPARAVGAPSWYLVRSGFAWGGMGVAACWYGGARGLQATVAAKAAAAAATGRASGPPELLAMHLGGIDTALHACWCTLADAAARIDAGAADGAAATVLALQVRNVAAAAAEATMRHADHALGPAPLAFDVEHAARMADLALYVRQHHAERDLAALGAALVSDDADRADGARGAGAP